MPKQSLWINFSSFLPQTLRQILMGWHKCSALLWCVCRGYNFSLISISKICSSVSYFSKSSSAMTSDPINGEDFIRSCFFSLCVQQIYGAWCDLWSCISHESSCFVLLHIWYISIHIICGSQSKWEFTYFSAMLQDQQSVVYFTQTITTFLLIFSMLCFWTLATHSLKLPSLHLPSADKYCCSLDNKFHLKKQTRTIKFRLITEVTVWYLNVPLCLKFPPTMKTVFSHCLKAKPPFLNFFLFFKHL